MYTPDDKSKLEYQNLWVIAEIQGGKIQEVTYELLGSAVDLRKICELDIWTVVLGEVEPEEIDQLYKYHSDTVIHVKDKLFSEFHDEAESNLLVRLIKKYKPEIILCGATSKGRALMPRVAVSVECGLTADCTELSMETDTRCLLVQTRPAYGGNVMATIRSDEYRPQMATVRPRVMNIPAADTSKRGRYIEESLDHSDVPGSKRIVHSVRNIAESMQLADAEFIITGGRGVKGPDGFELLKKLANKIGGAVGASRAAVDAGWIPYTHQIGQTGQTVQPKVYIACGVSGQIQHLVGMQTSDFIVAINQDKEAPIMTLADVAVVGDLFEIIPELIQELSEY